MATVRKTKTKPLLATGGGNATASGVSFQASVAAFLAAQGLAEAPVDPRLALGAGKPVAFRFETEAPVDDILVSLDTGGWAFIQGKNSLTNASSLTSELGKTCDEFARLWEAAASGSGQRGWDRPLATGKDAMVIAVGATTSGTIKSHLARALDIFRAGSAETLSDDQRTALANLRKLVGAAVSARGGSFDPDTILKFVYVIDFDFGGAHRIAAEAVMANALEDRSAAPAAFAVLEKECERRMAARNGISIARLRGELARSGVPMSAPHNYRHDVEALRDRTRRAAAALGDFERTQVNGIDVTISRACTSACVNAVKSGSLVLVGDPGAGKSAVINEAARILHREGSEVVLLAVDRLQVESLDGLSSVLGLSHSLPQVLANWPGKGPGYLVLDALDACRFGRSEALFRNIIQDVLELEGGRWSVVASIRTFDLMVGQDFARLFRGVPPDPSFVDQRFQSVRHLRIREWSDVEFDELLSKIPALRIAVDNGGTKLAELARVPFNTRLLADLLSSGVAPEKFRDLASQIQLLDMYWNERVRPLGALAEQCLRSTVNAMIERGRMEASRIAAGAGTGNVLDQLQQASVLIPVNGDRDVAFRHHIIFDYTASRVAIDLSDVVHAKESFKAKGASLLLAPALSFALQHLWETSAPGRAHFWEAIAELAGDATADPIARSVAARAGCDLPAVAGDTTGLIEMLRQPSKRERAFAGFRHIVSSLTVRLEDEVSVPAEPWCAAAVGAASYVKDIAWPLRTLLQCLVDRVEDPRLRGQLGTASRALMDHSFTAAGGETLMMLAISFVGKTFATDAKASRRLVERLIAPERMAEHAHSDMHWLAQEVAHIAATDAELVVEIYDRIFAHTIEGDEPTSLGQSRILALLSNRRQDFKMAQWQLKEAFPTFAREHPLEAGDVVVRVAKAYAATTHPLSDHTEVVPVDIHGREAKLAADWSYIWAAQDREAHSDDAHQIVDAFVDMLRQAPETDVVQIAERVTAQNESAWLWNRLFMVATEQGGALAAFMLPLAMQTDFLLFSDTAKPAIDLVASQFAQQSEKDRIAFERRVLEVDFPKSRKPAEARLYFQRKVFGAIGALVLITQEAKAIFEQAVSTGNVVTNEHDEHYFDAPWTEERDDFSWLRDKGVDVDAAHNALILSGVTACDDALSDAESASPVKLPVVVELWQLLTAPEPDAHPMIIAHGWEKLAWATDRITYKNSTVLALAHSETTQIHDILLATSAALAGLTGASIADIAERARERAASAIMNIMRSGSEAGAQFRGRIEDFALDVSVDVRAEIARKLGYLWKNHRDLLWSLVERFAATETSGRVLVHLVNFLTPAMNEETDRTGEFILALLKRGELRGPEEDLREFRRGLGTLIFDLWVRHERANALSVINAWLGSRADNQTELRHAAFRLRSRLVAGYDNDDPAKAETRKRAQTLAFAIIDRTATGLEAYFALDPKDQTEERKGRATEDAVLLEQMSDQFFFAVGAPKIREVREPKALGEIDYRKRFLDDNFRTFERVGDAATPKAIYYMLQLLEFLEPADPAAVFDLASHALLKAGKLHGYQYESLGADQFVRMIGRTIADHRELFDHPKRRVVLVEVLEVFVEAGWPGARRLLYRLPEALR